MLVSVYTRLCGGLLILATFFITESWTEGNAIFRPDEENEEDSDSICSIQDEKEQTKQLFSDSDAVFVATVNQNVVAIDQTKIKAVVDVWCLVKGSSEKLFPDKNFVVTILLQKFQCNDPVEKLIPDTAYFIYVQTIENDPSSFTVLTRGIQNITRNNYREPKNSCNYKYTALKTPKCYFCRYACRDFSPANCSVSPTKLPITKKPTEKIPVTTPATSARSDNGEGDTDNEGDDDAVETDTNLKVTRATSIMQTTTDNGCNNLLSIINYKLFFPLILFVNCAIKYWQ